MGLGSSGAQIIVKKAHRLALALGVCIIVTGCRSTSGTVTILDKQKIEQIKKWYSNKEDVIQRFDNPQHVVHNDDGSEDWVYEYTESTYGCLGPMGVFLNGHFCDSSRWKTHLIFEINQSGVVYDYKNGPG